MQLSLDDNNTGYQIRAYDPSHIQINDTHYHHSLIIMGQHIITPWRPNAITSLHTSDLDELLHLQPAIILLGTGQQLIFPDDTIIRTITEANIGLEIMNTGAACRTYTVLQAEGRQVAAALIIDQP